VNKKNHPQNFDVWIEARKRFKLTDCQIQMARELGLNPKKFGSLANHKQEPWKAPLGEFIEGIYFKRFKRERPLLVRPIEQMKKEEEKKKKEDRKRKLEKRKRELESPTET
jgi:hypothetical protein